MASPRPAKKPSRLPSSRFAYCCEYLLDCSYLLTRAKKLHPGHHGALCTNWFCKHDNPPQALAGQYACHGCAIGTFLVLPSEVRGLSVYVYATAPASDAGAHSAVSAHFAAQRRQQALDRIELARDLEPVKVVDYNKPLPGIPGLSLRKLNRWDTIPGTQLKVTVHPPKRDSYYAPALGERQSSSVLRTLRQRQPAYSVDGSRTTESQASEYVTRQSVPTSVSQASSFSRYTAVTSIYSQYEVHFDGNRSYF